MSNAARKARKAEHIMATQQLNLNPESAEWARIEAESRFAKPAKRRRLSGITDACAAQEHTLCPDRTHKAFSAGAKCACPCHRMSSVL